MLPGTGLGCAAVVDKHQLQAIAAEPAALATGKSVPVTVSLGFDRLG